MADKILAEEDPTSQPLAGWDRRVFALLRALAQAQRRCDDGKAVDEAFVWEPKDIERRPPVTFGDLREARALVSELRDFDLSCRLGSSALSKAYRLGRDGERNLIKAWLDLLATKLPPRSETRDALTIIAESLEGDAHRKNNSMNLSPYLEMGKTAAEVRL